MGAVVKIAVLDFETADEGADSACALGIVKISSGEVIHRESFLIRPPRQNFVFTYIHGITWADVKRKPTFQEYIPKIIALLEDVDYIAAHNAGFDRKVLLTCFAEAGHKPPAIDTLCTVKLARHAWDIRPTTLPDVCDYFDIALNHHDALSDANACAEILVEAIAQDFPLTKAKLGKPSYKVQVKTGASRADRETKKNIPRPRTYEHQSKPEYVSNSEVAEPNSKSGSWGWIIFGLFVLYLISQ